MASLLIVDDESALVMLMRAVLEKVGHTVADASNGAEALAKLGVAPENPSAPLPDLILLDVMMPVLDGVGTAAALQIAATALTFSRLGLVMLGVVLLYFLAVAWRPESAHALSFRLSYLAMAGLSVFAPACEFTLRRWLPRPASGAIAAGLGALAATAPLSERHHTMILRFLQKAPASSKMESY